MITTRIFTAHETEERVGNLSTVIFQTGEITRVIRSDAVRPGLLFVGTETGIFYSLDDGQHWTRMRGGLPVAPVYDLKIKEADLVAATHGRSFWILDDITPLREMPISPGRKIDPIAVHSALDLPTQTPVGGGCIRW